MPLCYILVCAGFDVFLVFLLPSTTTYSSFKLFWMDIFHQIPVMAPDHKKIVLCKTVCAGFEVFLVAPLLSTSYMAYLNDSA